MLNNIDKEIVCLTQKREIKVSLNAKFLQNHEIKMSQYMRTSKSQNKHVTKISCNKVTKNGRGWLRSFRINSKTDA